MKLIHNFGVNDLAGSSSTRIYNLWRSIIERCYSEKSFARHPSYRVCEVSEQFKMLSGFSNWCENQIGFGRDGWELDKDLLIKGNKEYHPEKCVFLPRELNGFLRTRKKARGKYPIGVTTGRHGAIVAQLSNKKERIYLGQFTTPELAFYAYKETKEKMIKDMANKYKNHIDPRAYAALMNYQVEITD